ISVNKKPFKELFDPENDSDDEIFHAISIVFPDVRLKTYLEFRMMDGVNYPTNFAIVALIKGLFYSKDSLNALEKMFEGTSYSEVMDAKSETLLHGLKAKYKGITILGHLENLYNLAYSALGDESHFLSPIKEIINSGKSPKDVFEDIFESEGLRSAIEYNRVDKNV
ncbi:MAG: glutamate--cysteine ligase, partial [Peptoniphilus sp.]|nr:glutamate--cysteine ligase [Peptoniphilus sp.]